MTDSAAQARQLTRGCVDVLPAGDLERRIDVAAREGRPLRIKLGMDPTAPDLTLGHAVVLQKLREFQDEGHIAVLIVGDYTARVGDPSGQSKTRPQLTDAEIDANARTYQEQAFRILDPERTEVRHNGEWLAHMTPADMFNLMRRATVAQILEREDFARRMSASAPISVLELLYPLLQGYDSVAIGADVEFGGTDQLFNLLMGRTLMPQYGMDPQMVITMPLLVGTDGVQKMSKSLGNYVGVTDEPGDMFGKTMSIPDEAMPTWFRLASGLAYDRAEDGAVAAEQGDGHMGQLKRELAKAVVARFHGRDAATAAERRFDLMFRDQGVPDDAPEVALDAIVRNDAGLVFLPALLTAHMGVASGGEARRLLSQGGVKLDGEPLPAGELEIAPTRLEGCVLQVGKRRFLRVTR